jgi:anti-sigma factor RsiW
MQCLDFEELISDYLDGGLARARRGDFCEHLLACRPCHLLFNDVRGAVDACHELKESQMGEIAAFMDVQRRIISATTAGEMLSCRTLDALISDYFDGLIESGYERIFREHFAVCEGCGRLVEGMRQSIEERESLEVPFGLHDRIFAVTSRSDVGRVLAGGRR